MKYILAIMLMLSVNVYADYVKKTMAVCVEEKAILELDDHVEVKEIAKDGLELEMWLMSHNCKIIDKKTEITVLDYTGKKTGILKIKLVKTGEVVFGQGKSVEIEQPGNKNIIHKF